jgi:non-ribosomal peptide synthetase component E (peptide arylation enzyme)
VAKQLLALQELSRMVSVAGIQHRLIDKELERRLDDLTGIINYQITIFKLLKLKFRPMVNLPMCSHLELGTRFFFSI